MSKRYVLKCTHCGAAAADCVRLCPYCGHSTGFEDLGFGVSGDGGLVIGDGASLVVGFKASEKRECPFCGASVPADGLFCPFCSEKIVIEQMRVATLEVKKGGALRVHAGASFEVIGRRRLPIHQAAQKNDAAKVKERIVGGDDPNHPDNKGARPLHYAARRNAVDAARYLLSVGANVDALDDRECSCLHEAAKQGHEKAAELFVMLGANLNQRDEKGRTPGELAAIHQHGDLASRLGGGT